MFIERYLLILVAIVWCPHGLWLWAVPVSQQQPQQQPHHKTYDQRQHGKINVHLNLKDFDVIGLLGSDDNIPFVPQDYEYVYDYAEMTLKPFAANKTTPATAAVSSFDPVQKPSSSMKKKPFNWNDNSPVTHIKIKPVTFNAFDNTKFKRFCAPGFTRDKRGNCHSKNNAGIQIQQIADLVKSFRENRIATN